MISEVIIGDVLCVYMYPYILTQTPPEDNLGTCNHQADCSWHIGTLAPCVYADDLCPLDDVTHDSKWLN